MILWFERISFVEGKVLGQCCLDYTLLLSKIPFFFQVDVAYYVRKIS